MNPDIATGGADDLNVSDQNRRNADASRLVERPIWGARDSVNNVFAFFLLQLRNLLRGNANPCFSRGKSLQFGRQLFTYFR